MSFFLLFLGRAIAASTAVTLLVSCADPGQGGSRYTQGGIDARNRDGPLTVSASGMQGILDQLQIELTETAMRLQLTPAQVPLWDVYQGKVSALMTDMLRPPGASSSALQQIGVKVDVARDRLTALEDVADAAKSLYPSLNERQRSVADRRLASTVPAMYSPSPNEPAAGNSGRASRGTLNGRHGISRMGDIGGMGSTPGM